MRDKIKEYRINGVTTIKKLISEKLSKDIKKKINQIFSYQLIKEKIIKKEVDVIKNPRFFSLYKKKY